MASRRDDSSDHLTSAEAAALLGVSASTVKRWVDEGALTSERTAGGHRRIRREAIHAFREEHTVAGLAPDSPVEMLLSLLLSARPARELEARLVALRSDAPSVGAFADSLTSVLREIGLRWARGALSIADEHIASERLARALARLAEWIPLPQTAPVALLATAAEDEHTLGLSLAELCLRDAGWDTRWVGRRTPTEVLAAAISSTRPAVRLVVLSASAVSSDAASLMRQVSTLAGACRAAGASLILGGEGSWPERTRDVRRVRSFTELEQAVRKLGLPTGGTARSG